MRKRRLRGLRARLVVAFGLVAAVAAITTGALTFREARTGVLQQSQDATIRQLRAQLNQHATELAVPPEESALREFAQDVAATESQGSWRVLVTYGDLSGSSARETLSAR